MVTVLLGARQLRATNQQLEQLQRATQLEGTMHIFDVLRSARFRKAQRFVFADLAEHLKDEAFRRDAAKVGGIDREVHQERVVMDTLEEIGTYVKNGLLNGDAIYDFFSPPIVGMWKRLAELIALQREAFGGKSLWSNFEFLYTQAKRYEEEHYPDEIDE